jgi:hypothetical protein
MPRRKLRFSRARNQLDPSAFGHDDGLGREGAERALASLFQPRSMAMVVNDKALTSRCASGPCRLVGTSLGPYTAPNGITEILRSVDAPANQQ